MCGLVGFYKKGSQELLSKQLNICLSTIEHRGKNTAQTFISPPFYSAHSRLKIIDLDDRSNQPFHLNERYSLLFNGEIYNYIFLKNELRKLGHQFHTQSDTEVIAVGFHEWGTDLFEKLDGMFSIVIYDTLQKKIILSRDIFGKKPLYYSKKNGFAFCSELNAFKILNPEIKISAEAINQFLSIGYTLHPITLYEDVYLLPPSTFLVYDVKKDQLNLTEYFQIENSYSKKNKDSYSDIVKNTATLFEEAIQKRLIGDVPWGIFLSSGLDSSGIAAICSQRFQQKPNSYTISYPNSLYDESVIASSLAKKLHLPHQILDLSAIDIEQFNIYLKSLDYSTFDNSSYPIYLLAKLAVKDVGFVLTGDGSDEIFGGYSTNRADEINFRLRSLIPYLKKVGLLSTIDFITKNQNDRIGFYTKVNRLSKGLDTDYKKAHYQWRLIFNPEQRIKIMGENFRELIYDTDPFYHFEKLYSKVSHLEIKNQHLYVDCKSWLTDNNLIKLDRNTMAHSLEARSPFLDKSLFEYISSCPVEYKKDKKILKDVLNTYLPTSIIHRKKTGFNSPVHHWFGIKENEFEFYTKYIYETLYKIEQ